MDNPMLLPRMGALDPYQSLFEPREATEQQYVQPPSNPTENMIDPQRMAWGAALQNIGDIYGGNAPRQNIGGAYMAAKGHNDKIRQNKAALARQVEQDLLNKRYIQSRIDKNLSGGEPRGAIGSPVKLANGNIGVTIADPNSESGFTVRDTGQAFKNEGKTFDMGGITYSRDPVTNEVKALVDPTSPDFIAQQDALTKQRMKDQAAENFTKEQSEWQAGEVNFLNSISAAEQKKDIVQATAKEIKNMVGGWTTGGGGLLSKLPGTDARKLAGLLDTLKANSAFTSLKEMKAAGATLGAIAAAELNLLEREWGALDQLGDPGELLRVLDQLVSQNSGSLQRLRYGYDENKKRYGSNLVDTPEPEISDEDLVNKYL